MIVLQKKSPNYFTRQAGIRPDFSESASLYADDTALFAGGDGDFEYYQKALQTLLRSFQSIAQTAGLLFCYDKFSLRPRRPAPRS